MFRSAANHDESGDSGFIYGLVSIDWASRKSKSDNRGVVQALNRGEVECVGTSHTDADFRIQVWDQVNGHKEQHLKFRVVSVKAHSTAKVKAQKTQQIGTVNDKTEELAKAGTMMDGAEFAEHVADWACEIRKQV